jgi:hypothetical protein
MPKGEIMDKRIIAVGNYISEFNNYLPHHIEPSTIYRSAGLEKHILKRHPDCLQYISLIPEIISSPDYIGVNPNETSVSFELVKVLSDNIQLGIKLDSGENYLYVATLHTITSSKLEHGVKNGRLKKFDK